MRQLLLAGAATAVMTGSALGMQTPRPAMGPNGDPHVQVADFVPGDQTLVVGAVGRSVTITFGPTEHIQRIMLESAKIVDGRPVPPPWQAPTTEQIGQNPLGNVLPLWVSTSGRSAGQVVTKDEDGMVRVYQFAFKGLPPQANDCAKDDCDDPTLASGITFIYPAVKKAPDPSIVARQIFVRQATLKERLKTDPFYGVQNRNYFGKGTPDSKALLSPNELSDNSEVTTFRYDGNRKLPAFYILEANGDKRHVTPTPGANGLWFIYEAVPGCPQMLTTCARFQLISGDKIIDIWNTNPVPSPGYNPGTGTTSPEIVRVVKEAKQ